MNESTRQSYKDTLRAMVVMDRLNGSGRFVDLNVKTFERMAGKLSPSYQNITLSAIKWLLRNRYNLSKKEEHPLLEHQIEKASRRKIPKYFDKQQVNDALAKIDLSASIGLRNRALIMVSICCGLRRAEAVNLKVGSVDFERGRLFIESRKGGDEDSPRLMPLVLQYLKEWIEVRESLTDTDSLFISPYHGNPITLDGIRAIYTKQVTEYFGRRVTSHMMRHTMVKIMRDNGATADEVMMQGGWRDRKTFKEFYDCLDLDMIAEEKFAFGGIG